MTDADFLTYIGHTTEELETAKIDLGDLRRIYTDHEERLADLNDLGAAIQRTLARFPNVHSTRVRVKSPRSLAHKVVRKRLKDPERDITFDTYKEEMRDLIGVRALHLFKEEWQDIHSAVKGKWNFHKDEIPLAYIREGDSTETQAQLEEAGLKVIKKDGGYRSLHYIIESQFDKNPTYAEVQVRTLFEEAWSEIDHTVRYPDNEDDRLLSDYLLILNRLVGGADEMASLLLRVKSTTRILEIANAELLQERADRDAEIERLRAENNDSIEELDIPEEKKADLKQRFESATTLSERPDTSYMATSSRKISEILGFDQATLDAINRMNKPGKATLDAIDRMNKPSKATLDAIDRMNKSSKATLDAMDRMNKSSKATLDAIDRMNKYKF